MNEILKNIELCVFDMAGTTIDEDNLVYKTLTHAVNQQGYNLSLAEVLTVAAGKEKHAAITDVLKQLTNCTTVEKTADIAFDYFNLKLDEAYTTYEIKPIAGVTDLFNTLREQNIKLVLNTGYSKKIASLLLDKLNWQVGKDIDALITADDVVNGRPAPDMIQKAMSLFNIDNPKNVLKAGDSDIDILEGKNAECGVVIGVLSGAHTERELTAAQPDYILNTVTELLVK